MGIVVSVQSGNLENYVIVASLYISIFTVFEICTRLSCEEKMLLLLLQRQQQTRQAAEIANVV
jgi:hypothetical protein